MSDPDIDPYAILGVSKEATLPDIKSAHRKLVLKCHPDKIQDESLRAKAQDEFQKVQQAYELLSDDARRLKYDQKVRLMELRREMLARGGSAAAAARGGSASSREFRNGRIYEERVPGESFFFEDEVRFTEEPQSTGLKHDEYGRPRHRAPRPPPEERRRSKPTPTTRVPRETTARDSTRAHYLDRDKHRTKARRREAFAKSYERSAPYVDSDGGDSDESNRPIYIRPPDHRKSKSKPRTSNRSSPRYSRDDVDDVDDDDDDDEDEDDDEARAESKHDKLHNTAKKYIRRTRSIPPIEVEPPAPRRHRHHRSSRSPPHSRRDESIVDPDSSARRTREPTPKRPSRESVRHPGTSSRSRHGSYEHLEPRAARSYEAVPSMPTTTPAPAPPRPSVTRSATMNASMPSTSSPSYHRVKRESSARAPDPTRMVYEHPPTSRPAPKYRKDRYDSGYSSPGTPDMGPRESGGSPPKSTRYKIVDEPDLVESQPPPPPPQTSSSRSSRAAKPIRSNSYIYPAETSASVPPLSSSSSKPLYNEIPKYPVREINPDTAYAPHVVFSKRDGPRQYQEDHRHHHHHHPSMGRRQSAYA